MQLYSSIYENILMYIADSAYDIFKTSGFYLFLALLIQQSDCFSISSRKYQLLYTLTDREDTQDMYRKRILADLAVIQIDFSLFLCVTSVPT